MASRPGSRGDGPPRPYSTSNSIGIGSVGHSQPSEFSHIMGELAEEVAASTIDGALGAPLEPIPSGGEGEELALLRAENDQLNDELRSARSELELAILEKEEMAKRSQLAQQTIEDLRRKVDQQSAEADRLRTELSESKHHLHSRDNEHSQLQDTLAQRELQLSAFQDQPNDQARARDDECARLRARLSAVEQELNERSKDVPSTQPTLELMAESSGEDPPLLAAAYQQISVLNTQLAHLYTELTMARTEAQHLRSTSGGGGSAEAASRGLPGQGGAEGEGDAERQSQQIADLVGDIRHLQLDLEYHQQKLDHMIEEKQKMMKELKQCRKELVDARQLAEEREQLLKHREVDLQHMKQELSRSSPRGLPDADQGMISALRTEAAAKDSALIVSHYELHKEKLMRDRLEQKNMKLMERMQKLMMVVETMRRENLSLEKIVVAKDKVCDEREVQLRQVTLKAKQLQKLHRASKGDRKAVDGQLALEPTPSQGLPPLGQRSLDSQAGRASGLSTPRTPRCPPSPYGTR